MSVQTPRIRLEIGSRFENIELVQTVMETSLRQLSLASEASHQIGLAVREAVANAIKHGNRQDPEKRVDIEVILEEETVVIRVADQGVGFDPGSVPDPLNPDNLLRPNGRGLFFMKSFMDQIEYEYESDRGMVVTLRKRIAAVSPDRAQEEEDA